MIIDPKLAEDRLSDPGNVLNRVFNINNVPILEVKEIEVVEGNPDVGVDNSESSARPAEEVEAHPDEALNYLLGLRTAKAKAENSTESTVINWNSHGRSSGATEIPTETRVLMGTLNALGERQTDIAKAFGTSTNPVHRAKHGNTKKDGDEVTERVNKNMKKVVDKALDKLVSTLDSMDENRIEDLNPKEQAQIASQLSKVVGNLNPKEDPRKGISAQLIIYAPTQVNENHYETVELGN